MNSTKLKVAFYCSSLSHGGLELNIIRFVNKMKMLGREILLFLPKRSFMYSDALEMKLRVVEIEVNKKYLDFKRARKLAKVLNKEDINIVFTGATRDVAFVALVKRFFKHDLKLVYHQQMQLGISKKDILHTLRFSQYDSWIAPLPYLKKEVGERTRYNTKKVSVVPLCIETRNFTDTKISKEEARKILNLPPKKKIIGILGRIDPLKRQDFLIRAIQYISLKGYEADLLIMGEPTANTGDEYMNMIRFLIKECKLEGKVHIRPFSTDTLPFYKAIDIFAMTTKGETFGMVTVEAMASGVPVVAAKSGGSIEILEHGKLGLLYESGNQEDFAEQVIKIFMNPDFAKKMTEEAKKIVIDKYDLAYQCREIEKIITNLAEEK